MIKKYKCTFQFMHKVEFEVDTKKMTQAIALTSLQHFYSDRCIGTGCTIKKLLKMYAAAALKEQISGEWNTQGIIYAMKEFEGFYPLDGSMGIKLIHCDGIEIDECGIAIEEL